MEQFPHLKFKETISGKARFFGGSQPSQESIFNKNNRNQHSANLGNITTNLKQKWVEHTIKREEKGLAPIDNEVQPIFLKMNPNLFNDSQFDLKKFNIEIISEEDDGFIVGASLDNLRTLENKIAEFKKSERGAEKIADLWEIIEGDRESWKPKHILSPELFEKWNKIEEEQDYHLEVSIAFDKPIGKEPDRTRIGGESRYAKYCKELIERDEKLLDRQSEFEDFISNYEGKLTSGFIELEDSFGCSIRLSGKGLKDLVLNYQYVFEVAEVEDIESNTTNSNDELSSDFETIAPDSNAVEIGVIDSGIQEEHKFISKAIHSEKSKSYLKDSNSTADNVPNGGHGTKVAGSILYPNGITNAKSPYQLPCFVRNLKVLDKDKKLESKSPSHLIKQIVEDNHDCKVFNQSINSTTPFRKKHMSLWAATLDYLTFKNDILFINSVGNKKIEDIRFFLQNGDLYPYFLHRPECRIANPAQSCFSLAVGSINHCEFDEEDWKTIGAKDEVSPFSRIGTGIWGMIKPDVVEYGGALKVSKNGLNLVTNKDSSIEHLRSTLNGGSAYGCDDVGTSLAAPKVSYAVAQLRRIYPDDNINLLRALIVQGARLPKDFFLNPTKESLQYYGYGIPSIERVTKNTEHRITFYNTNKIQAEEGQIYTLNIPESIRNQGDEYDILIEVTLAYTANVRRTRQKTKSYLSTWLEWECSKIEEKFSDFKERVLSVIDGVIIDKPESLSGTLSWKLGSRANRGTIPEISRNNSTLQKDWTIIKSYELPEELSFAVLAHKGWDKQKEPIPYALTVSIEILGADIPIYEEIRLENEAEIEV